VEEFLKAGLTYGDEIEAEVFEKWFKKDRTQLQFQMAVAEFRAELERKGMYLSGRGYKGAKYVILQPRENAQVMENYGFRARKCLGRAVVLGTNTQLELLSQEERARHDKVQEIASRRLLLMSRKTAAIEWKD